jgi:hypothetical protein
MKIFDHERKPLVRAKGPNSSRQPDPESIESRCKREGITIHPSTIRNRMRVHDLTFEEAVAFKPTPRSKCGRIGKSKSAWRKTTPGSSKDYQLTQGRKGRCGEPPTEEE